MSESSYATVESWKLLWYERAVNAAAYLGAMGYGLHIAVFYSVTTIILRDKERRGWVWLPFASSLFALGTVNIACSINFNQLAWIDERNYPNGPAAFLLEQQNRVSNLTAIVTSVIMLILADSFLILRCHLLWKKIYITVFLFVVLLASTVISILHSIQVAHPARIFEDSLSFSLPYASLAASLNMLITLILFSRLIDLRRRLSLTMDATTRETYASIPALIIESAFPAGIFSFVFVVLYSVHNSGAVLVFPLLVQIMGIIPELIVLRIAQKRAWSMDIIRAALPASPATLRNRMGRSGIETAGHEVSMVTLNDNGSKDSVVLKAGRDFVQ
ncbi:hypothetical protein E4T56_gene13861 [Termitomyces sp. T112]|nr:hypothetical protein E4T56_gene13861 [Termitomyces sp. T112]KAH0584440.1 hypothetical protein H2248_009978 [Termitomyces sp. 'cryptogamus']KNZ79415.1 hypothetical protein J132_10225 [Termitomyces sp. J132]